MPDLLGILDLAAHAHDLFSREKGPAWLRDERSFQEHFGAPFQIYEHVVSLLTDQQLEMLHNTLAVNPEAAVLWILHMEEIG